LKNKSPCQATENTLEYEIGLAKIFIFCNDFDMNRRIFCGNLEISPLDGCDVKKRAATALNFILRVGWWLKDIFPLRGAILMVCAEPTWTTSSWSAGMAVTPLLWL
jgi:hypothetical protein